MKRINKYIYLWVVQGYYNTLYGWEDLTASEQYKEAQANLRDYKKNDTAYGFRIIQRRELNPEYQKGE
jgi:hypothetical protein